MYPVIVPPGLKFGLDQRQIITNGDVHVSVEIPRGLAGPPENRIVILIAFNTVERNIKYKRKIRINLLNMKCENIPY